MSILILKQIQLWAVFLNKQSFFENKKVSHQNKKQNCIAIQSGLQEKHPESNTYSQSPKKVRKNFIGTLLSLKQELSGSRSSDSYISRSKQGQSALLFQIKTEYKKSISESNYL